MNTGGEGGGGGRNTAHTARPTATSPRTLVGLVLIATLLIVTALWAPPAGAQDGDGHHQPEQDGESGIPVEVVSGEGELGPGDVLHLQGDYVPAEGASITLADEDGTTGTFTDAENATLLPGAAGIGVMIEDEPTEVQGGNGALDTTGLRAVSSDGIDRVEEAAASVEEDPDQQSTPARADEESGQDEPAETGSRQPNQPEHSDADRIKQAVARDMNERLSDAGMPGSGMPDGAADSKDSTSGSDNSSPPSDDTRSNDSGSGDSGSSDPADDDTGTNETGVNEQDEEQASGQQGMFAECFPFCDVEDPGSSGSDAADDDSGSNSEGSGPENSSEDSSSEGDDSTSHSESSEGGTTTIIESSSDQDSGTNNSEHSSQDNSSEDSSNDRTGPGQDPQEQNNTDGAESGDSPESGHLLDNMNLLDPIGEDAINHSRSTDSGDGSANQEQSTPDTSGQDTVPEQEGDEAGTPQNDDTSGTEPPDTEPSGNTGGSPAITGRGAYCGEDFGGVQPHVAEVGCMVFDEFGVMDYSGYRHGDPQDHGKGLALDFMVYEDKAKGDAIADYGLANQQGFAITYIIWYQQINFGSGWEMMEDRGSVTENHIDHPHFSHEAR